ncbi:PAS domain S-box protein [Kamptonema formosum]|uniref:PAS domain S-box protein n=1 Tax=Kamptonema formosum TaxID=331992 RepID=UPI00034DD6FB|nr:PAS domain S-box protein [Oscillatoria sp. PCC 10802]
MNNTCHQQSLGACAPSQEIQRLRAQVESLKQALEASVDRHLRLMEAMPLRVWAASASGEITYLNRRWYECGGAPEAESLDFWFFKSVHPEDRERLRAHLLQGLRQRAGWEMELRLLLADGSERWAVARTEPVLSESGAVVEWVGTCTDTDKLKRSEQAAQNRAAESEKRYQLIAEHSTELICTHTPEGIYLYVSPGCRTLLGYEPDELVGHSFYQFFHPEDAATFKRTYGFQGSSLGTYALAHRLRRKDGRYIWVETTGSYLRHQDGDTVFETVAVSRNISELKLAEAEIYSLNRELDRLARKQTVQLKAANQLKDELLGREQLVRHQAMQAERQVETERKRTEAALYFLAEASGVLGVSLDYQTTLENLAQAIVPFLADWCAINVIEPEGSCRCLAVAHKDPSRAELVRELHRRYPASGDGTYSHLRRLRGGETDAPWCVSICLDITDEKLAAIACDEEHLQLLRALNLRSCICLPVRLGRQIFGSVLFALCDSSRRYTSADLTLAEDLVCRAANAVEKALLYRQAQETGENLREAILILGEHQHQLRTVHRLTNLLNQRIADLPGLLQVMVEAVCESIPGAQFCLIVLYNPESCQLQLTATAGPGTENLPVGRPLQTEDGVLSQVFSTGESRLLRRESGHPGSRLEVPAAVYAVAIESREPVAGTAPAGGRLGVLAVGNWEDAGAFDPDDQLLLGAVGEQAAIAINNARLIKTLEEREELLAVQNNTLARQNRELESLSERIGQQNLQLIEAARLKSQFLATMSHELRTPLNVIMGFSQVLLRQRQNPLAPKQTELVERILSNGENLLMLIDDILDLSKIEAGARQLKLEPFDVAMLVRGTVVEFRAMAQQKNLTLQVEVDLPDSHTVNDRSCLRQILANLLSNAIKFTESGGVRVSVLPTATDQLALAVADTGIGIAETDLQHIFEPFRQVDQALNRKYPGTGLGLALTQSLVRLMQGTISVDSQVGVGSTFCVELPRLVSELS